MVRRVLIVRHMSGRSHCLFPNFATFVRIIVTGKFRLRSNAFHIRNMVVSYQVSASRFSVFAMRFSLAPSRLSRCIVVELKFLMVVMPRHCGFSRISPTSCLTHSQVIGALRIHSSRLAWRRIFYLKYSIIIACGRVECGYVPRYSRVGPRACCRIAS